MKFSVLGPEQPLDHLAHAHPLGDLVPARHAGTGSRASPCRRGDPQVVTDFILDSACLAAEQTLLDQRLFMVSGSQAQALMDLLVRPEQTNEGLRDLFARQAPWDALARLAVSRENHGRGLGVGMLQDAIRRTLVIASPLRQQQLLLLLKDARTIIQ